MTTALGLEERRNYVRVFLRISADDGVRATRGYVGAGQIRPPTLALLREALTPIWLGAPHEVVEVARSEMGALVHDVLENPARRVPVVVPSVLEEGGWVVEPDDLLWELFGRARLYVLPRHELTFDLTDTLGDRRHSAYWGAAHAYLPDFSRHDDYHTHPLLVHDRLRDPVIRAAWLGELGLWMAPRVELPRWVEADDVAEGGSAQAKTAPVEVGGGSVGTDGAGGSAGGRAQAASPPTASTRDAVPAPAAEPPPSDGGARGLDDDARGGAQHAARREPSEASPEVLHRLLEGVSALADQVARLRDETRSLTDEVARLRTISAVRSASTSAVERRLAKLEASIEGALPRLLGPEVTREEAGEAAAEVRSADEGDDDDRLTLFDVVEWASESHADVLEFLDSASSSAIQSPYEDPERVRAIFDAMALVGRRRQEGALGTSLKDAFADLGVDYRAGISRHTPARLRQQHRFTTREGIPFEAEEHIALGGTYDPRRCLRIYFSSRLPDETRFVIAHVGRHFEVMSST